MKRLLHRAFPLVPLGTAYITGLYWETLPLYVTGVVLICTGYSLATYVLYNTSVTRADK